VRIVDPPSQLSYLAFLPGTRVGDMPGDSVWWPWERAVCLFAVSCYAKTA